ncbi:MFS transporter [Sulfurivermis fontis]|uniref:MFS transporter n=1 Tax=Sulfurivermis fontis TaxID=1972068 RepID=UPI000FDB1030|nr:MFS transporter [Sulfurivermis fontis]
MTPTYDPRRFQQVRWAIYAVLVLAYMSVFFHRMAPAVVSAELMMAFHTTGAVLGSLAAMYYYIYTVMQIPAGVLADTVGTRAVVTLGNLVAGIGSIVFGLAESMEMAMTGRFLVGLGVSVIFVGLMKSNTVWFRERIYGLISGVTLLLGNVGSILAAGPLAWLLGHVSWRAAFVGIGVFSLLLAVLSLLIVRNRPEDAGFPSVRVMEGKTAHAERERHWLHDMRAVWGNLRVWPGFWFNFGMAGGLFAFAGLWGIPLLRDVHGLSRDAAAQYTTLTLLAMALGTLLLGWISDRLGRRQPVMVGSALLYLLVCAGLLWLPWTPGTSGKLLFALLGLCGSGFVLSYACAKEVCAPALSGMAISVVNTGLFLGAAIMQPLFGWVLDRGWDGTMLNGVRLYSAADYHAALWLMLGFAAIAFVAALRLTETRGRNITVA